MFLSLSAVIASAQGLSGVIIDEQTKEALAGVNVSLLGDSTQVVMQTSTNENGWFSFGGVKDTYACIELTYTGYESQRISLDFIDGDYYMGEIKLSPRSKELEEVVVSASRVIEKVDKYVLIPSVKELERASASLNLLSEMKVKMPGLQVNEGLKQVLVDGGSVVFQINGKEEPFSKVEGLNHREILRVEYRNTPDIRYADRGVSGVINFVMKPRQEGGSIMVMLDEAVTALRSNVTVSGSYHYKKSEWSLMYGNNWHKRKKQFTDINEQYIGRDKTIFRNQIGRPSYARDFSNALTLGYTYMYDLSTMFSANLNLSVKDVKARNYNAIEERIGTERKLFDKYNPNETKVKSPSIDLYFRKNISEKQSLELNAIGTLSNGDYSRQMHYLYNDDSKENYSQVNSTKNDSWALAAEALYTLAFKNVTTRYGVNYKRNYAENKYSENDSPFEQDNLTRDNLYFYGDLAGKWKKLGYTVSAGGKYFHSKGMSGGESYLKFKATATLNFRFNNHWNANYLYMYSPEMPSLSVMNDDVHTIDDISVQMGNLYIKPSTYQRHRLYLRYNTGNFYATAWGSYSRTNDPINSVWHYDSDPASKYYQMFIHRIENGNYTDNINVQVDLSYQNLFNHLTLSASVGWDKYSVSETNEDNSLDKVYASISANAYFGKWTIYANYAIAPRYSLDGRSFCRDIRYDYFGVKYRWRDFSFGARVVNAFTKRGFLQKISTPSKVHPIFNSFYIKDYANLVELNFVYRIDLGKSYNRANRTLQNKGIDTGVDVEY